MMVPRAFLFTSAPPHKAMQTNREGLHLPDMDIEKCINTAPVVIPAKRPSRKTSQRRENRSRTPSKNSDSSRRSSSTSSRDRPMPNTVASILDATAIPVRRRSRTLRGSRKLPRGNHVEDFSRMLQEAVKSKEEQLMDVPGNSALDILLSPPGMDNEKLSPENDSEQESPSSLPSNSSDSMPSLEHDLSSPPSLPFPSTPSSQKRPSERRQLRYTPSEDCASDHPLLDTDLDEAELVVTDHEEEVTPASEPTKRSTSFRSFPHLGSTVKSNLTASLRALKSAAQSVSTFAAPSVRPDDVITRSLFSITPQLTDDRRPAPMQDPPSPALRRYLNPTPISPAEMQVYHDDPHEPLESYRACAVSIQMQTYRRISGRGHRRNHFHITARDHQYYTFDPEIPPLSRQREARENSDFLRMVVLEMNMRRSGKLREDIPTRARIWLPPRKNSHRLSGEYGDSVENETAVPSRWVGVSIQSI